MIPQASDSSTQAFYQLTPDVVVDAVESTGFVSDLRILPLNSFENRVYQVGIEDGTPVVVKFYRPGRWSDDAILEEHRFTQQLQSLEIPAVAPLADHNGQTLHFFQDYRFAVYPRVGGYAPEAGDTAKLARLGRMMGRLHEAGGTEAFQHRLTLDIEHWLRQPAEIVLAHALPPHLATRYQQIIDNLANAIGEAFSAIAGLRWRRCHGDCHMGNILWADDRGPLLVDFDDCCMAPAIQDIWMFFSGDRDQQPRELNRFLEGYETFCEFDDRELKLVEPLRTLRMIHYAGWLAKRWPDPTFPRHFPWFAEPGYWERHLQDLADQLDLVST